MQISAVLKAPPFNSISTSKKGQGGKVQGVQGLGDGKAEGFEGDGDPFCWQS